METAGVLEGYSRCAGGETAGVLYVKQPVCCMLNSQCAVKGNSRRAGGETAGVLYVKQPVCCKRKQPACCKLDSHHAGGWQPVCWSLSSQAARGQTAGCRECNCAARETAGVL